MVNLDIQTEIKLQSDLQAACRHESEWWRLKSRCKWLNDGDKNTSFFHKQAEVRKNFNRVLEIQSQDRDLSAVSKI